MLLFLNIKNTMPKVFVEEFKSWIQNLGYEDVLTTLYSYGHVQLQRQGEIIQQLKLPRDYNKNVDDIAKVVLKVMAEQKMQSYGI